MSNDRVKTINLRDYPDLDLDEVSIRVTNSRDTLDAAGRCVPADGERLDSSVFMLMLRQETIFGSVTAFVPRGGSRTEVVGTTCTSGVEWSNRTREFVGEAYDYHNGMREGERVDFRKRLAGDQPKNAGSATP